MNKNYRNRFVTEDPTCNHLFGKCFPETMIQMLVNHSNSYTQECEMRKTELDIWKGKNCILSHFGHEQPQTSLKTNNAASLDFIHNNINKSE